jgi:hypothetical protein
MGRPMTMRYMLAAVLLLAMLLSMAIPVLAAPAPQQTQVQITSPEINAQVHGMVPIMGSALVPNFQFYKVEFGVGPNPAQWAIIGDMHDQSVVNGQLEVWDTTRLPDGVYSLRLHAVKQDGNYEEFIVRQIAIANSQPTATPTSEMTPTPESSPTPGPLEATPRATTTVQIIAPTAALSQPSPTPTLSRPIQRDELPVDPKGWPQAFCYGSLATGAVFVLLGIVFGLRRLL